ncbi:MAG: glycosyltransferase family 4 protein [Candidatus Omnitrophica bacterium]|nr:glycosyltransferase family 4 protein [Candidatus Omnitrophota bacterium]
MKVAFIAHCPPHSSTSGAPMTCWGVLEELLKAGHQVTYYCLSDSLEPEGVEESKQWLAARNVEFFLVQVPEEKAQSFYEKWIRPWKRLIWPDVEALFPSFKLVLKMKSLLEGLQPDVIFAYHYTAIAATHGLNLVPRMAGTADLWHWPNFYRWQRTKFSFSFSYLGQTLNTFRNNLHTPRLMAWFLNHCESVGCFGAYDAAWLRKHGANQCAYLKSPIVDAVGENVWQKRKAIPSRIKPRILLGPSNVTATSTNAGIRLFAEQILPVLEKELGKDGFEVRIVGGGTLSKDLAQRLDHPSVKITGAIRPADDEFLSADIQLCPTPILLGIRLRIVTGLSFGCCLVAHTYESANIPELVHEENCLLGSTGEELARQIVRVVRDVELRKRLQLKGRETYEKNFKSDVAAKQIVAELERLAKTKMNVPDHSLKREKELKR